MTTLSPADHQPVTPSPGLVEEFGIDPAECGECGEAHTRYVLHYVSQDLPGANAWWSVYREEYPDAEAAEPIDGATLRLAWYPTEAQAQEVAAILQAGVNHTPL